VVFEQRHRPGQTAPSDFTHATELGVTIVGERLVHMLPVGTPPFSNWQWVTMRMRSPCAQHVVDQVRAGLRHAPSAATRADACAAREGHGYVVPTTPASPACEAMLKPDGLREATQLAFDLPGGLNWD
jgi:hypothetical protein